MSIIPKVIYASNPTCLFLSSGEFSPSETKHCCPCCSCDCLHLQACMLLMRRNLSVCLHTGISPPQSETFSRVSQTSPWSIGCTALPVLSALVSDSSATDSIITLAPCTASSVHCHIKLCWWFPVKQPSAESACRYSDIPRSRPSDGMFHILITSHLSSIPQCSLCTADVLGAR